MKGYGDYKKQMGRGGSPNLFSSGSMLKSFTVLDVKESGKSGFLKTNFGEIKIEIPQETTMKFGWTDSDMARRAYFNKKKGRDMLGLPFEKVNKIINPFLPK